MKRTLTTFGVIALLLFATASIGLTHSRGGYGMHDRGGYGMGMYHNRTELTADQQQALESLQNNYAQEFDELEVALDEKRAAYQDARANDKTTIGELNQLHDEMFELRDEYRSLRLAFKDEASQIAPEATTGGSYCNYGKRSGGYCDGNGPRSGHGKRGWHHERDDAHQRGGYGRGGGCW